jgi:hypothetical protein
MRDEVGESGPLLCLHPSSFILKEKREEAVAMIDLTGINQPWNRLPREPAKWYARFEIYLSLGPERSVTLAHLRVCQMRQDATHWTPPAGSKSTWYHKFYAWQWEARAEAWDEHNRANLAHRNEERRREERETRIQIITQQLHNVDAALLAAKLNQLETEEARRLLPTLRALLRDMLEQQRYDLEPLPVYDPIALDEPEIIPFSADVLAAAQKELLDAKLFKIPAREEGMRDEGRVEGGFL